MNIIQGLNVRKSVLIRNKLCGNAKLTLLKSCVEAQSPVVIEELVVTLKPVVARSENGEAAIQLKFYQMLLDCFASLATTGLSISNGNAAEMISVLCA